MAPVIAAALIGAASTLAKSQQDKRAAAGQGQDRNYQVEINTGDDNGMKIDQYEKPQTSSNNNKGAIIDAAGNVIDKVVTSKMESSDERLKNIFGDNEDAIKVFANLNAIKFTYNDKTQYVTMFLMPWVPESAGEE